MGYKDLHNEPFDEGTIAKLEIFESYSEAWIPTFVMNNKVVEINVFDFFAGTGYDKHGVPGSPIRILQVANKYAIYLIQKKVTLNLYFNEYDSKKFLELKKSCEEFLETNKKLKYQVKLNLINKSFESAFSETLPLIKKLPSLVYLDQNGIKFLNPEYLLELEKCNTTDFLYFVSSSYLWRFGNQEEFKKHLAIDLESAKKYPYTFIHKSLISQLKGKFPNNSTLKLYPFTIKKPPNIYGIIFGAKHPRAVDKFLKITWNKNSANGEANFDIHEDEAKGQFDLFKGERLTKIELFKKKLAELIIKRVLKTNTQILNFTYEEGHIPAHATECIKELKISGLIEYQGKSPLISYENIYKKKREIEFQVK